MDRLQQLIEAYRLVPHPEGGAFSEVYTAAAAADGRSLAGSIYFLLRGSECSHLHRIDCEEVWYHHEGCALRLTLIDASGAVSRLGLGRDLSRGQRFMVVVPKGVWFAAENLDPAGYSFVSCMTAPKFTYDAFELMTRGELARLCPAQADALARLALP